MAAKRKGLGRGLDVLLSTPVEEAAGAPGELSTVDIDLIVPGKYQPRVDMRPETLTELADSITAQTSMCLVS